MSPGPEHPWHFQVLGCGSCARVGGLRSRRVLREGGQGARPWGLRMEPTFRRERGEPPRGAVGVGDADAGRGSRGGELGLDHQNRPWSVEENGLSADRRPRMTDVPRVMGSLYRPGMPSSLCPCLLTGAPSPQRGTLHTGSHPQLSLPPKGQPGGGVCGLQGQMGKLRSPETGASSRAQATLPPSLPSACVRDSL